MDTDADLDLEQLAAAARRAPSREIAKQRRLITNLEGDIEKHGDPARWKRYGDLLLASVSTAVRQDNDIIVTDYFDDAAPSVAIPGESNKTISEVAEEYFRRYTKARNGLRVINDRLQTAEANIAEAKAVLKKIAVAVETNDVEFLSALTAPDKPKQPAKPRKKKEIAFKGARRFVSSDGIEILVGKKAADNDFLTFRIARSLDVWMHAADYPGSHVVVRLAGKKEVPHNTLIEAARLAAFYSDAREHPKAAVRYAQKKFVNKPRKGPPGLVSLSNFKTILVEPGVADGVKTI